jgi:hypothetical protein
MVDRVPGIYGPAFVYTTSVPGPLRNMMNMG